ncbi:MAG: M1 family metallopeptidase [Cytophagales bacterium]|nr:M1 family metallopeptidase [Cytophagales bacterium]MDW8383907.1 M1 family metallopeptidase [Flammeovirgaceae bacterium]
MYLSHRILYFLLPLWFACSPKPPKSSKTGLQYPHEAIPAQKELKTEDEKEPVWASKKGNYNPEKTKTFRLHHVKLDIKPDWEKQFLYGKAYLKMSPWFYSQDSIVLDAKGFDINNVSLIDVSPAKHLIYKYDSLKLTIQLPKTYYRTDTLQIFIEYTAKPNLLKTKGSRAITEDKGLYFINPTGKNPYKPRQLWTQGETEANSCWFPIFDQPNQKTTQEILLTVADSLTTISNGKLIASYKNPDGTRTDHWKQMLPHAPYLFAFCVGKYAKVTDWWRDKEVSYYVEPAYEPYARNIFGKTPEMIDFFSKKFDYPFPWDKYSQVVVRDFVSGAMENTTVVTFMERVQSDPRELLDENWEQIIAHELSHHWFGDLVTCESWANLPLNESFANYAEYLWLEYAYGKQEADWMWEETAQEYFQEALTKQEPMIRYYYLDKEDMFDRHSYSKGCLLLHLLRAEVGDEAFFKSLALYLKRHQFQATEIHHLRLAFEEVTGRDLQLWFQQWFLSAGHPELYIKDEYQNGKVILTVFQRQNTKYTPLYELPLATEIWVKGKSYRYDLRVQPLAVQSFEIPVEAEPELVLPNADMVLPAKIDMLKTTQEFIFQYYNATHILAKKEALQELASDVSDSLITPVFLHALSHPFWGIRQLAAESLENYQGKSKPFIEAALRNVAQKDQKSIVRATAVRSLATLNGDRHLDIYAQACKDSSYLVASIGLLAYVKYKGAQWKEKLAEYETSQNLNILYVLSESYISNQLLDKASFFENKILQLNGFPKEMMIELYSKYLKILPENAQLNGIAFLEKQATEADTPKLKEKILNALKQHKSEQNK